MGDLVIEKTPMNSFEQDVYDTLVKEGIGLVPQYGGLIHDLTLSDNLKLVSEIHIKEKEMREHKVNKLIAQFEFESLVEIKSKYLSGGQRKN